MMAEPKVLNAWPRTNGTDLIVWCRYCHRFHSHGAGEGHRVPHCYSTTYRGKPLPKSPHQDPGYILRDVTQHLPEDKKYTPAELMDMPPLPSDYHAYKVVFMLTNDGLATWSTYARTPDEFIEDWLEESGGYVKKITEVIQQHDDKDPYYEESFKTRRYNRWLRGSKLD